MCRSDADRLASDEVPGVRMVHLGDRWVPWFAAGEEYDGYAHGYFGPGTDPHRVEAARVVGLQSAAGAPGMPAPPGGTAGVGSLGEAPPWPHHRLGGRL